MGIINILDKSVAELIAAGEVIERPASIVKELIENSIDAGASVITVEIQNGGIKYIRITDNGSGIARDDVPKAFIRHATSKIKDKDDLDSIFTLGFRGEALASIAAVAHVEMLTRMQDETAGTLYSISGSQEEELSDIGCPKGTTIIIRDLFYNTPARMKFLKKDTTEANAVSACVDRMALSHPQISFKFIKNGVQQLVTPGDGKLKSAIFAVYGRQFADNLIEVDYQLNGVSVSGYMSKPEAARPNRNMQTFFVNGRYVKTKTAMAAIEEACKGSVMVGKFPACVLNIDIDPSTLDVNVHPAKIEIRFSNDKPIFEAVYHGCKTALAKGDSYKSIRLSPSDVSDDDGFTQYEEKINKALKKSEYHSTTQGNQIRMSADQFRQHQPKQAYNNALSGFAPLKQPDIELYKTALDKDKFIGSFSEADFSEGTRYDRRLDITADADDFEEHEVIVPNSIIAEKSEAYVSADVEAENNTDNSFSAKSDIDKENNITAQNTDSIAESDPDYAENKDISFRIIGQAFKTYIMVECEDEIILIDKHAAHERILYEQIKKDVHAFSQLLLNPVPVTLDKGSYGAVLENMQFLCENGLEIEDFGGGCVLLRTAPSYVDSQGAADILTEIAGKLYTGRNDPVSEKLDWIYHSMACRAAIKGGDTSGDMELYELAKRVLENNDIRYCPHGRPVCITLTKKQIERQFGRIQ